MMSLKRLMVLLLWVLLAVLALQCYFAARIGLMAVVDPQSTAFQRSEAWRLASSRGKLAWRQQWVDYDSMPTALKRAVIAAEDSGFTEHTGVEWQAIESAWKKNTVRAQQAEQRAARSKDPSRVRPPKVVGGSTISQQLAKNLLLSGERNLFRKGQELLLTLMLEALLDKRRILEIYLNSVEWGEGIFGAEAAARHYFNKSANRLTAAESAHLAVMLPAPKFFEKRQGSSYLSNRVNAILQRMTAVDLPA